MDMGINGAPDVEATSIKHRMNARCIEIGVIDLAIHMPSPG